MLELPVKFKSALGNGVRTSLFPVIRFYKDVRIDQPDGEDIWETIDPAPPWSEAESVNLSIKETNLDGIAFDPLLLNTPSIKSSADVINNKYTISSVSLSISNAPYKGKIFSDDVQSLLNAVCQVYYCANGLDSLDDCLLVYTGTVRRFNQSAESIRLELEDLTEQMLSTQIPASLVPDEPFYKEEDVGKPFPMVYGYVDKSPVIKKSTGLYEHTGEIENILSSLQIDKQGRGVIGLWTDVNIGDYGWEFLHDEHPLVTNGYIKSIGNLYTYGNGFVSIGRELDLRKWVFYVDGITDYAEDGYNPIYMPAGVLYDFVQSGTDVSASIQMNGDALIADKKIQGLPSRIFRPIDSIECFTYCDNNNNYSDAINRIYGFTGYDINALSSTEWEPWEKSDNIRTSNTPYDYNWSSGNQTWWEPTLCNDNTNGPETSSIDDNWALDGRDPKFPVERLQNGLTSDGIYLCGQNPDGTRDSGDNRSGGAYVRMKYKQGIGSVPSSTKLIYDAEYHMFDGMEDTGNMNLAYWGEFWNDSKLIVGPDHPGHGYGNIDYLAWTYWFPSIPSVGDYNDSEDGNWFWGGNEGNKGYGSAYRFDGYGELDGFNSTTTFESTNIGIPQYPKQDTQTGNDDSYVAMQLFNAYTLHDVVIDTPMDRDFYADVKGRYEAGESNPVVVAENIMQDILRDELNYNGNISLLGDYTDWQHSFTLDEQKEAKEVFEGLFKSSLVIPSFDSEGQFKFLGLKQIIEDSYSYTSIHGEDIIKYAFQLSKIDDVKNQVNVKYRKNYASGDFDGQTGYSLYNPADPDGLNEYTYDEITRQIYTDDEMLYNIDYYGLTFDEAKLEVETEYIRDEITARKLQKRLVSWYANQHLITKIDLPVKYMNLEVGDYIRFDELLGGKLAFGQDYTTSTNKNGQLVYPVFFINRINKSLQKVSIEAIQVHRGEYGFPLNWEDNLDDGTIEGSDWDWGDPPIGWEHDYDSLFNVSWLNNQSDITNNPRTAIVSTNIEEDWDYDIFISQVDTSDGGGITYEDESGDDITIDDGIYTEENAPSAMDIVNHIKTITNEADNYSGQVLISKKFDFETEEYNGVRIDYIIKFYNENVSGELDFIQRGIYIGDITLGDINFDGVVNILDVVALVQYVMGQQDFTDQQMSAGDMNQDGGINILDIVSLMAYIVGGGE